MRYFVILLIFLGGIAVFSAHGQYMGNISDVQPKKSFPMEKVFPPERRMGNNQTLDIIFDLKSQEYVEIPTENLTITFLDVFEDSRCPIDVTCAWTGNAGLRFDISTDRGREITLGTFANNTGYVFDKYKIQLIDVKPYPTSTNTIKSEDYIASLKVTKDDRIVDPKNTFAKILSPLKQYELGIPYHDIQCKDRFELVGKMPSAHPACVKSESVEKLVIRGWATTNKTLELTSPTAYMIEKNGGSFEIQYSLNGATLENIEHDANANSVHITLDGSVGGHMIISIPRDLLDAKIVNGDVDVFFLLIDGEENMYGEKITDDERIITVWFPKGAHDIEIIGTFWI